MSFIGLIRKAPVKRDHDVRCPELQLGASNDEVNLIDPNEIDSTLRTCLLLSFGSLRHRWPRRQGYRNAVQSSSVASAPEKTSCSKIDEENQRAR